MPIQTPPSPETHRRYEAMISRRVSAPPYARVVAGWRPWTPMTPVAPARAAWPGSSYRNPANRIASCRRDRREAVVVMSAWISGCVSAAIRPDGTTGSTSDGMRRLSRSVLVFQRTPGRCAHAAMRGFEHGRNVRLCLSARSAYPLASTSVTSTWSRPPRDYSGFTARTAKTSAIPLAVDSAAWSMRSPASVKALRKSARGTCQAPTRTRTP
jgi:hypothetical protein